ncbi:auxilin-related protein 2 isoform X2 [Malus sylvestris]|uniref:auxilin-related protein 2 isoform X2 n=1 Tax=Malus sylvestris TaxID=3752 RepID=UPI0021AC879B|nr:auxilin-related protein 2 isoform X2 [Malus sylvestris]
MDEFGVLTERFGLKPQGKSAPMASSKRPAAANDAQSWDFGVGSGVSTKTSSYSSGSPPVNPNSDYASFVDGPNGLFQSSSNNKTRSFGGLDDIFTAPSKPVKQSGGSSFNFDSMFVGSNSKTSSFGGYNDDYDVFAGMPGLKSSSSGKSSAKDDDIFGSFASGSKQSAPVDDLLGDLSGVRQKLQGLNVKNDRNVNSARKVAKKGGDFDDLIPGFGGSTPSNNGTPENRPWRSTVHSTKSNFGSSMDDPFVMLESVSTSASTPGYDSSDIFSELEQISKLSNSGGAKPGDSSNSSTKLKSPPKGDKERSSGVSSIDELEEFARATVRNNATGRTNVPSHEERVETSATRRGRSSEDDLMGFRSNSVPRSKPTNLDSVFDSQTNNRGRPTPQRSSGTSSSMKKSSSATGLFDGLFSMDGEFEEVEGESEERRKARLARHQRSQQRALQAVADMNQRDRKTQQEQEDRRRIAENLDIKIKSWSYGKEGNMRALLSSLQSVLWAESGWEPVSLTDLITSGSVKRVYRKATLCVHPDKVQQKGASLEQKYTAEKVFDILKEAWNKFNKEELS